MIFLCNFRNVIKRELKLIGDNIAAVILAAFLASAGGVILWINGGSTWYFVKNSGGDRLGLVFSVWVISYALVGASLVLLWLLYSGRHCDYHKIIPLFALCALSYLFMLVWYALFFCTRLSVFAGIVLIFCCVIDVVLFLSMRKTLLSFEVITVLLFAVHGFFVYFSFAFA